MKVLVISYSLTGNNNAVADSVAAEFAAEQIKVSELLPRGNSKIMFDILFNRTPAVKPMIQKLSDTDLVIFFAPVWMGHVATPLRAYFKQLKPMTCPYAFVSVSGGADGANPKLAGELYKRLGSYPAAVIDLHVVDLLPSLPKPSRDVTAAYRLTETDVKNLSDKIVMTLREKFGMEM